MNTDTAIRRAQVYRFLADVFLYPSENWLEDLPLAGDIARQLDFVTCNLETSWPDWDLPALQGEHLRAFGLTGSLCYETEVGLPHEFRQSQEMADLAGFYRAFGFNIGGKVRERPDHISAELEFMYILALKEAYAIQNGVPEQVEICVEAQGKFLQEHLGQWVALFAEAVKRSVIVGLTLNTVEEAALSRVEGPLAALARFTSTFVLADAARLGVTVEQRSLTEVRPTPPPTEISCDTCPVVAEQD